ncbi:MULTISPECIES: hypothetical protein [Leuconostoc]|uniref:hypothetical protein n=1 Tax=Leuconostoc TaxID=1243 RepID=UPI0002466725|nr:MULTISPECIES: hypothetical protein [Leuconostoc]MCT3115639.1 hypothetical protein [Leuconostoc lactis]CCF27609.1 Putative uncharacterized protein [Leuconostoc citreum LBAE C11]
MALEVKKIHSLSAQAIEDLKAIEKIGGLEHLAQLSEELKKAMADEEQLRAVSPMLPPYFAELRKNLGFLLGTAKSLQTHGVNRTKDIEGLLDQLSHIK